MPVFSSNNCLLETGGFRLSLLRSIQSWKLKAAKRGCAVMIFSCRLSSVGGAAIDRQTLPGQEGGGIGSKEQHGAGEVVRRLRPLDALLRDDAHLLLRAHGLAFDLGEGGAGQDRV